MSTIKNVILKFKEEEKICYYADHAYTMIEGFNLSPPIGIKARKWYGATQSWEINRDVIEYMPKTDIDNPIYDAIFGFTEATTNIPLHRLYNKMNNVREALDSENTSLQRIMLMLGWSQYNIGIENVELKELKEKIKERKKKEKKINKDRTIKKKSFKEICDVM